MPDWIETGRKAMRGHEPKHRIDTTGKKRVLFASLSLVVVGLLFSADAAPSGEIFDPFSRLDDYLRYKTDYKISEGDVEFYMDSGYLTDLERREVRFVLMVSIPESELRFIRDGDRFFADYRVSLYWKNIETGKAREKVWDKRDGRSGDSRVVGAIHLFKEIQAVKEGHYKIEVEVEDRNDHRFGQLSFESTIPALPADSPSLSTIFLHAKPEGGWKGGHDVVSFDKLQLKALGIYSYAEEPVAYYVEVYGIDADKAAGFRLKIDLVDSSGVEIWSDERSLDSNPAHRSFAGEIGIERLDLGEYRLGVSLLGPMDRILCRREKPVFIASSDRWLEDHFNDVLEFLRYIASETELRELKSATEDVRLKRWREFWEKRDPLPATPVNETEVEFFRRLNYVNRAFKTHIEKGWLTDRGRVYLSLGPPDEVNVRESSGTFGTWEIWIYDRSLGSRVILYFEDRGFTGDFRLVNPGEFLRAKDRLQ